ncbi:hypothetical protein LXA43DRAFT_1096656 [Ganoderma leucocontextum]|nr:hypothetical protein LXA43DRAFT_1096656 [Ganoderma leucocontextum]
MSHEQPEGDDSNVAEEVQDELAGAGAAQPSRKRARKSRNNGAGPSGAETVAKRKGKSRQTAGSLSELMNMPLDVFFEVAGHLHPLDMLNLARTSKSFRSVLLAKSSRSAWIASLTSVDTLPSCPHNMSEPLYAALLFDHHCFLCGAERAKWVDYAIRLRLCKACYKANIRKGSTIVGKDVVDLFRTLPLFPCETGSDDEQAQTFALPENRTAAKKYYIAHVNAVIDKYTSLEQQDREAAKRLMEQTLEDVAVTQLDGTVMLVWSKHQILLKETADMRVMVDRKSKIIERLQDLGHTVGDFPDGGEVWEKLVRQHKPLTDRIWNNIRPKLEEQIAIEKDRRIRQAFQQRVDNRLDVIVQWYDNYVKEHFTDAERSLMPNVCDARELPSLHGLALENDAQGALLHSTFLTLTERMLTDVEAYKTSAKRALVDTLCNESEWDPQMRKELKDVPIDDVLQGYYAYFRCMLWCDAVVDSCACLTYEQLHSHWREAHPHVLWLQADEDDPWDRASVAALWPYFLPTLARRTLEAVGIPLNTSRSVLDGWVKEGRLFCACEYPGMPLPGEMDWGKLLSHLLQQVQEYHRREREMMQLSGKRSPSHTLRESHPVAGDGCCFKFLPDGADTAAASVRATVDDACRAQIEAKLAARPEPGAIAVCRICKGLTRKTPLQIRLNLSSLQLPERPEEIVWHLRTCHGKEFEKRDIVFVSINL